MKKIRVFLQQRVIPTYRIPFLENLAAHPFIDLTVFAGQPMQHEMIKTGSQILGANFLSTRNIHLLRGPAYFCYQTRLITSLEKHKPQLLILEGNARYLSTRNAFRWAKKNHAGLIGWGLGVPNKSGVSGFINQHFWINFLHHFDAMIAYSETGAQQYIKIGFSPQQVFTAVNATTHRPSTSPPQKEPFFHNNSPILLYVGRLQPRKRLDNLMCACAQLSHHKPQLWIVGEGLIRSELEKLAKEIYPETKFFGEVYGEDLRQIYYNADLFVLPGTGGLAVQQAMAHALPVVMAAGDGTQANLVYHETGWTVPANDEPALRETINTALSNPELLRKKGAAAFTLVKEQVNIETMTERFMTAIEYVFNQKDLG